MPALLEDAYPKLAEPGAITEVFHHVAAGGSPIELAASWGVKYTDLVAWLYDGGPREAVYTDALSARAEWGEEVLLRELRRIALVDVRNAFTATGELRTLDEMPAGVAACISQIETDELWEGRGADRQQVGVTRKVRFHDKLRAIELLGKRLGLFEGDGAGDPDKQAPPRVAFIVNVNGAPAVAATHEVLGGRVG